MRTTIGTASTRRETGDQRTAEAVTVVPTPRGVAIHLRHVDPEDRSSFSSEGTVYAMAGLSIPDAEAFIEAMRSALDSVR